MKHSVSQHTWNRLLSECKIYTALMVGSDLIPAHKETAEQRAGVMIDAD